MKKMVAVMDSNVSTLLSRYLAYNGITYTGFINKLLRQYIAQNASEFTGFVGLESVVEQICKIYNEE